VAGGQRDRGAVVDDPNLNETVNADHDLIKLRIVGDGIKMRSITLGYSEATFAANTTSPFQVNSLMWPLGKMPPLARRTKVFPEQRRSKLFLDGP
jgi:hypothetical protein